MRGQSRGVAEGVGVAVAAGAAQLARDVDTGAHAVQLLHLQAARLVKAVPEVVVGLQGVRLAQLVPITHRSRFTGVKYCFVDVNQKCWDAHRQR